MKKLLENTKLVCNLISRDLCNLLGKDGFICELFEGRTEERLNSIFGRVKELEYAEIKEPSSITMSFYIYGKNSNFYNYYSPRIVLGINKHSDYCSPKYKEEFTSTTKRLKKAIKTYYTKESKKGKVGVIHVDFVFQLIGIFHSPVNVINVYTDDYFL